MRREHLQEPLFVDLPEAVQREVDPKVIREGKIPSAYFLEKVGAKGMHNGGIHVADYHANLIYNAGGGTASQVREIVDDLKKRVRDRYRLRRRGRGSVRRLLKDDWIWTPSMKRLKSSRCSNLI